MDRKSARSGLPTRATTARADWRQLLAACRDDSGADSGDPAVAGEGARGTPSGDLWDLDLFVLHVSQDGLSDQAAMIGDRVASVTVFGRVHDALRVAQGADGACSAFVVNIDIFPTVEQAVDELLALRRANRNLIVVILSSAFARDELSAERQAIADASLRLPCTAERLAAGLSAAVENAESRRNS